MTDRDFWQFIAIALMGLLWLTSVGAQWSLDRALRRAVDRISVLEAELVEERRCRVCQCTDEVACWSGCWWVEEDLCSSCADDLASSLEGGRG